MADGQAIERGAAVVPAQLGERHGPVQGLEHARDAQNGPAQALDARRAARRQRLGHVAQVLHQAVLVAVRRCVRPAARGTTAAAGEHLLELGNHARLGQGAQIGGAATGSTAWPRRRRTAPPPDRAPGRPRRAPWSRTSSRRSGEGASARARCASSLNTCRRRARISAVGSSPSPMSESTRCSRVRSWRKRRVRCGISSPVTRLLLVHEQPAPEPPQDVGERARPRLIALADGEQIGEHRGGEQADVELAQGAEGDLALARGLVARAFEHVHGRARHLQRRLGRRAQVAALGEGLQGVGRGAGAARCSRARRPCRGRR